MASKKLFLNTLSEQMIFDYDSAEIFTHSYSAKIKPRSIHIPTSAKIILTHKNVMSVYLVSLPIIKVDRFGDIIVHTHIDYQTASLENADELLTREDVKLLKAQFSSLTNKKVFGATSLEVIKEREISSQIELIKFIKKIRNFTEGGGF